MREVLAGVLGGRVELVPRPAHVADVEETGDTLSANARLKAEVVAAATGLPAVADDTGLEVDALEGAPGVRSARYSGGGPEANVALLLENLRGVEPSRRTARFRTAVVLAWPSGESIEVDGVVEGLIASRPVGDFGFGYDPVFEPLEGDGRTFAEMDADEKHAISHRGRSLRALAEALLSSDLL